MRYITKQYEIGEPIEIPKGVVNPNVVISQRGVENTSVPKPVAILTYLELTEEEMRELKLRQMQQGAPRGATLIDS